MEGKDIPPAHLAPPPQAPLTTQNHGASMMMHHPQMYPAGYQMPPSAYPYAPPTPDMAPMGPAPTPAPPHTMMYPHAPPATPMNFPSGYASGSSTPVHPNARSPARSRKASQGVTNVNAWMGHMSAPGTPGPGSTYSRAGSVMSHAPSAMTGINEDAMSVISGVEGGPNLTELHVQQPNLPHLQTPAVCHQTENIDPAQTAALLQEAANAANALSGSPDQYSRAATALRKLFKTISPERVKEALQTIIFKVISALVASYSMLMQHSRRLDLRWKLFHILHKISGVSKLYRMEIVLIANQVVGLQGFLQIILEGIDHRREGEKDNRMLFLSAVCVLTNFIRDEDTDYYRFFVHNLREQVNIFSFLFNMMINRQAPTVIELVCRMMRFGNRILFRTKITGVKVNLFLNGVEGQEGVYRRSLRKLSEGNENEHSTIHNIMCIAEKLVRNDSADLSEHEDAIRKYFIDMNIFAYVKESMRLLSHNKRLIETSLRLYANLVSSQHITDAHAQEMAQVIGDEFFLKIVETKTQVAVIHILDSVSRKRPEILRQIVAKQGFNYACHLVFNYANQENLQNERNTTYVELISNALDLCIASFKLDVKSEGYVESWAANGPNKDIIYLMYKPEFCTALLNILVAGPTGIKIQALQVMVAAMPFDCFRPLLLQAHDSLPDRRNNLVLALVNALNDAVMTATPSLTFLRSAVDLLAILIDEEMQYNCIVVQARSNASHFPINVLFCPAVEQTLRTEQKIIEKLLEVCKKLLADQELQQSWAQYREKFSLISSAGEYGTDRLADEILLLLGTEGDNDFSMSLVSSFMQ